MPLPSDNTKWPPEGWAPIYELYEEHAAWYSGDPNRLAHVYANRIGTPTPRGRFWASEITEERRTMLHVPLAGDIASTSADLLFSEPPKIQIPEAHGEKADADAKETQDRLDTIVQEGGVLNRLIEAAETSAAMGGVLLVPEWDTDIADFPILSVAQADAAIPEFRWGIMTAVTLWRIVSDPDDKWVWRHVERHEPGLVLHGLYRGRWDTLGSRVALDAHPDTAGLQDEIRLPFDGLAARYIPNMRPNKRFRGSALGQSDYNGSEGLMDALDEVYTSWMRDIRLGRGRLIVPEMFLEMDRDGQRRFDVDKEIYSPLDMDPRSAQNAGITPSQFAIRTQEHNVTTLSLIERIVTSAGYSPQSFGLNIEGRAESGTALRLRERKSFVTQAKKQRYWRSPLEDVLEAMLAIDREILRSGVTVYRPRVEMQDSIAPSTREVAESVELVSRARAASTQTLVQMLHPEWEKAEVDAEVKRILEEQGASVPDPFQTGVA